LDDDDGNGDGDDDDDHDIGIIMTLLLPLLVKSFILTGTMLLRQTDIHHDSHDHPLDDSEDDGDDDDDEEEEDDDNDVVQEAEDVEKEDANPRLCAMNWLRNVCLS